MKNRVHLAPLPTLKWAISAAAIVVLFVGGPGAMATPADAPTEAAPAVDGATPDADEAPQLAKTERRAEATTVTTSTADTASAAEASVDESKPWSVSLTAEASIGIGTFVSEPQDNAMVATTFAPSGSYKLTDKLTAGLGFSLTWYQIADFGTPLNDNKVLLSDISLSIGHGSIWKHDDSGFNLSGAFKLGLPTSLASRFQNRLFTITPSLTASLPVGPVTFTYTLALGKFFNSSATPSVDCDDFDNPDECIEGRKDNPSHGYESERRGAEVYLPGTGVNSFYVTNSLGVRWTIIEGLNLSLGVAVSNVFGVRSFGKDETSTEAAREGRSQTDRLVSSLALSYQVIKQLSVGMSLVTATSRPFGAQGDDLVIFDFERASSNITSWNISVTGTL